MYIHTYIHTYVYNTGYSPKEPRKNRQSLSAQPPAPDSSLHFCFARSFSMSPFSFTLKFSSSPPHFEQTQQVPKTGSWPQRPGSLHLMSFSCAFQECAATDQQSQHFREIPGADNSMQRILMAPGQSCCALAILLAIVNFQHGGEDRSRGREPWRTLGSGEGCSPRMFSFICEDP
jgi:hypothetical protein